MLRRFCAGYIDIDGMLNELPLSSGEVLVVRLAGNLYNGGFWTGTPLDLVSDLDREMSGLCINRLFSCSRRRPTTTAIRGIRI